MIGETAADLRALRAEVAGIFAEVLKIEVPDHGTDLLATGLLDSLGFVDLLVELERRFGVQVAMEAVEPANFRSVTAIATFVSAEREAA